jgi:hypothetical protein
MKRNLRRATSKKIIRSMNTGRRKNSQRRKISISERLRWISSKPEPRIY